VNQRYYLLLLEDYKRCDYEKIGHKRCFFYFYFLWKNMCLLLIPVFSKLKQGFLWSCHKRFERTVICEKDDKPYLAD